MGWDLPVNRPPQSLVDAIAWDDVVGEREELGVWRMGQLRWDGMGWVVWGGGGEGEEFHYK